MQPALILLHGALGSADQWQPLAKRLEDSFQVYPIQLSGHGGAPFLQDFSIAGFACELLQFIKSLPDEIKPVHVCGYSMGGYVAAYVAVMEPKLIQSVITLGTKWIWDETVAEKEGKFLNPETMESKVPDFANQLSLLHAPNDWKEIVNRTRNILIENGRKPILPMEALSQSETPFLLICGDQDKTVGVEETNQIKASIPNASMAVLPQTPHALDKVPMDILYQIIHSFCSRIN